MKRYAIVRVGKDGNCLEEFVCKGDCNNCDYGDTKEQLVNKVAQVMYKQDIELAIKHFGGIPSTRNAMYKRCLKSAKEIVEFLGVVE